MKKWWAWGLIPVLLGLLLATWLQWGETANLTINVSFPLSAAIFIGGLVTTILGFIWIGLSAYFNRQKMAALGLQQKHAEEDRRRFMQRLDHELKNPLTAIRAGIANLASADNEATRQVALGTLSGQTVRLSRLTADLRKLADLGTRPLERTPIDMHDLLTEVVTLVQKNPDADQRQWNLILPQAPWPLPDILGDQDLLFLAIYNLTDNALKYSLNGDTIEIRARQDAGYLVIEVADTGIGIPAAALPHVWEELYRGENSWRVAGSGLGLALVKGIVELHKGQVTLASRIEQGTNVTIQLPVPPGSSDSIRDSAAVK